MKLLLDTHIYIALLKSEPGRYGEKIRDLISAPENELSLSVATFWEMSIKWRLGKLGILQRPQQLSPLARSFGLSVLPIKEEHVVADISPEPPTRDPFAPSSR
jgi:PIN domain nuclease of toxin-antitoxin system